MGHDEIKEETGKYLGTNENENITLQNLWDAVKAVLTGKFTVIQAFFKKQEKSQINDLTSHPKNQKKNKQNPKSAEGRKQ